MPRRRTGAAASLDTPVQQRATIPAVPAAVEQRLPGAMAIPVDQIVPDPDQPRRNWDEREAQQRLGELAASIREFGILQPILVRDAGTLTDGRQRYMIIAGERRWRAARSVSLESIPALVRDDPQVQVRLMQLLENLHDEGLSQLDQARAFQELMDLDGSKPPELAARLHVSAQHIRDCLRVLANQVFADAVERRQIAFSVARKIMQLPDEEIETFRRRVRAGERLQNNDIAVARARMDAAGVVNPRRKRAPSSADTPADDATPHERRAATSAQEQALLVPSADAGAPDRASAAGPNTAHSMNGLGVSAEGARSILPAVEGEEQAMLVFHRPDTDMATTGVSAPTVVDTAAAPREPGAGGPPDVDRDSADAAAVRVIVAIRGLIEHRGRPTHAALGNVRAAAHDLIAYLDRE